MRKNLGIIFFFGFMLIFLAGSYLALSRTQRELKRSIDRLGADLIVYPKGGEERDQPLLVSLFPTFLSLDPSALEEVRSVPGVEIASPISYVQSFDAVCCQSEIRLIGYDPATNFIVPALVVEGNSTPAAEKDLLIGFLVGRAGSEDPKEVVGAKIASLGEIFAIRGVMERTRSHADVSAFIAMAEAERILGVLSQRYGWNRKPSSPSAILVRVKGGYSADEVAEQISRRETGLSPIVAPISVLNSKEKLRQAVGLLRVIDLFVWGFASIAVLLLVYFIGRGRGRKTRSAGASTVDICAEKIGTA